MSIIQKCDFIPVCSIGGDSSDHKVLVDQIDSYPTYILDSVSRSSLIKIEPDADEAGKFKFLVNTDGDSTNSSLCRCISNFSLDQIDSYFTDTRANTTQATVITFPITIPLGDIRSFGIFFDPITDIQSVDKLEIAIVSNTSNTVVNSKLEFLACWYGIDNANNTCRAGTDNKTFFMNTEEEHDGIVTTYNRYS